MHVLLMKPWALKEDVAESRGWRSAPNCWGPYRALAENLGREGRARLAADLPRFPPAVAEEAEAALATAAADFG